MRDLHPNVPNPFNPVTRIRFDLERNGTFDVWAFRSTWHCWGGSFDPTTGLPVGFDFTSIDAATDFMRTACSWEAVRFLYDYEQIMGGDEDVPRDDDSGRIDVPILSIEPTGGLGATGRLTLGLMTSADVTIATASLRPPERILEDFGHLDIGTVEPAPELVWAPLPEWV